MRHGKSYMGSELLPAYLLGEHPGAEVMLATYGTSLSREFGLKVRDIISQPDFKDLYNAEPDRRSNNLTRVWLTNGSKLHIVSRGGAATGLGADFIIIDDPFKDYEEARSQALRNTVWNWWNTVIFLRRQTERSPIAIINTRWHYDDLCGKLLKQNEEMWRRLTLPAIALEYEEWVGWDGKTYTREPGEALWPEKFSLAYLKQQEEFNPYFYALFQQTPSAVEGKIFRKDDWRFYTDAPPLVARYLSIDSAMSENDTADYTVIVAAGLGEDGNLYVLDESRGRWDFTDILNETLNMIEAHKSEIVYVEDHGSGSILIQQLLEKPGLRCQIAGLNKSQSKQAYARGVAHYVRMGMVYLPKNAAFTQPFIHEFLEFDEADNDDRVDCLTQLLNQLRLSGMLGVTNLEDFVIEGMT